MVRDLFLLQNLQHGSGAQQVFYSTATRTSFRRVMRSVDDGEYSRPSSDEVKSSLSYISALLVPSWCVREQLYVFSLIAYLLSQSLFSSLNIYLRLTQHANKKIAAKISKSLMVIIYRVSQEECEILRESVPYVKLYRYNPKHLYPKLNGYGDNGHRKVRTSCISAYCTSTAVAH